MTAVGVAVTKWGGARVDCAGIDLSKERRQ
jgi:hypothetical protein